MANSPFEKAHYEKIELNKKTAKKIKRAYSTTAKQVNSRLAALKDSPINSSSDALKKMYLENLLKDLNKSIDTLERIVQATILESTEAAGQIAVKASVEAMEKVGLKLEVGKAFSYVPRQEIANILSGKLYGNNWSFSKAIWGSEKKTKEDLEKVVARGLAENKPVYDIAKDLEKYVDPSARKPWDWSKVYPGTAKTVDYNAQRLARTMIQHSFQTSMVQAQRYNPFCKGIIWHSVGLHGRTCATCRERDGQVFPVKDLPLDHPNGLCYFEPALDPMNDIADRLGDWVNGGSDPALDTYVANAFNMKVGSAAAKAASSQVKSSTMKAASKVPKKKFSPSSWIKGVKKNTEADMLKSEKEGFSKLTGKQRKAIKKYSGSSYIDMNSFLRKLGVGKADWGDGRISDSLEEAIKDAIAGLNTTATKETIYLRRGSDLSDLAGLMPGDFDQNLKSLKNLWYRRSEDFDTIDDCIEHMNSMFENTIGTFHGFTSTSSLWDRGFAGMVEYIFEAPAGTGGSSIMTISRYGTSEGEFLLNAGTKVRVKKIVPSDYHKGSQIRVFLEIIV